MDAENWARVGMLAALRDVQEYVDSYEWLDIDELRAYLLGQLIVAGAYDDGVDDDGEG